MEARAGGAWRVVFVAGRPGIGKTTLAVQARSGRGAGAVVLFGRCDEESLVRSSRSSKPSEYVA